MLISYNWLQTFFEAPLPTPDEVAEALTFYSSEIDGMEQVGADTVFDVKVLPDKSAWLMSHRGVAKELSVILNRPLQKDPLAALDVVLPTGEQIAVKLDSKACDYYSATLIENISVGPSPEWLRQLLEAVGQKSINNIVDITNYVMLTVGQPLHAFDAETLHTNDGYRVGVRAATADETFVSLTNESYNLTTDDAVIVDGKDEVLALAGVKGGLHSGITNATSRIILEAAHFDRVAVRKTAQRHKLPTDAAKRYENGISRAVADYGVQLAVQLLIEIAGGTVVESRSVGRADEVRPPVTASLSRLSSVLGVEFDSGMVSSILDRFGYTYSIAGDMVTITPPFERDDITIEADVIEEIGRMYGLDKIVAIPPAPQARVSINKRHYYAELIREVLIQSGFSEVYTSSFRAKDKVQMKNAFASDKGYVRSSLTKNLAEARERNLPYRDLLGVPAIKLFEIGTVFSETDEEYMVAMAVQTNTTYKAKLDEPLWREAIAELENKLGTAITTTEVEPGVVSFSLDALLSQLAEPAMYHKQPTLSDMTYQAFSNYPPVSRDVAMWVREGTAVAEVAAALRAAAPADLLARITHLDTFTNDEGRTSVAFRLIFQSNEKTLDGSEVDALMASVYDAVAKAGWEVR